MRLKTIVWRAHHPLWAWAPDTGDGAAQHGGRFNAKGIPALYTSSGIVTALAEAQQGFSRKIQPMTLVAYDVDCDNILDLTDPAVLLAEGINDVDLRCAWRLLASSGKPVPSQMLAARLIKRGVAGIMVRSFEAAAAPGEHNIVFWTWSRRTPHRVEAIDEHGRLPAPPPKR